MPKKQFRRFLISDLEMYLTDILPEFSCKRCSQCCRRKLIPLYQKDIERLNTNTEKFYGRTTKIEKLITGAEYKMLMNNEECIFLEKGLCKYYDLRPNTCRRHPFLVTERNILVSSTCPGINWGTYQSTEEYRMLSTDIAGRIDSFLNKIISERARYLKAKKPY
jgi:Fe-S-cluster containining protein